MPTLPTKFFAADIFLYFVFLIFIGNLFAQNINNIAAVNLLMETNPLILDATNTNEGTDEETNPDEDSDTNEGTGGSVVIIATVRDASGNPLEGVPVNFTNTSSYGIFANSNVISGSNGVASNTLQNIQPDDTSIISDTIDYVPCAFMDN